MRDLEALRAAAEAATPQPQEGDLRVWWIPQIPMKPFHWPVADTTQAILLLDVLAEYDLFQYENRVKGDYANAGGLNVFEDGEWVEWCNDDGDFIDDLRRAKEPADAP